MTRTKTIIKSKQYLSHKPKTIRPNVWTIEEETYLVNNWKHGAKHVQIGLPHRTLKAIQSKAFKLGLLKNNPIALKNNQFDIHQESLARTYVPEYGIDWLYNHPSFKNYSKKVIWTWVTDTLKISAYIRNTLIPDENLINILYN